MALLDRAIVRMLPAVPKPVVRKISERYIAGTELEDACRVVKGLNAAGKMATIDVLGEEIAEREEALEIAREYDRVFEAIEHAALDSNVSVKLTGLGLKLGYDFCRQNLMELVPRPRQRELRPHRHGGLELHATTRSGSTATRARRASTTSASCSRPHFGARSTTWRLSPGLA